MHRTPGKQPEHCIKRMAGACLLLLWCVLAQAYPALALSPPVGTQITNTAEAAYADANGNDMPELSASVSTEVGGAPVLKITKTASSDPIAMGSEIVYTILYSNQGNAPATGVIITDNLSGFLTFQEASDGGVYAPGPPGGGRVTWSPPDLAAGASGSLTIKALVKTSGDYAPGDPDAIAAGSLIYNTANIESNEIDEEETIITTVGSGPNLVLTKSVQSNSAAPGGEIQYTLSCKNLGNAAATNVRIQDDLPDQTSYVENSATGGGALNARTLSWSLGNLAPGASGQVAYKAQVSVLAKEGAVIANTGVLLSNETGGVLSNEVLITVSGAFSLALKKTVSPASVRAGENLVFSILAENNGAMALSGITVADPLPHGATFVSADNGGVLDAQTVTWSIDALAPGQTQTLTLEVKTDAIDQGQNAMENTATARAPGLNPISASATAALTCRSQGVVSFVGPGGEAVRDFSIGDQIYLTVQDPDRNLDPLTAETVTVTLSVPGTGDAETIILTESMFNKAPAVDSGLFFGGLPSSGDPASPQDGTLQLSQDIVIDALYEDPLDPLCGLPGQSQASILVEPGGVVFDAATGAPVAGVQVILFTNSGQRASTLPDWPAGMPDVTTTGADGAFSFRNVPYGSYFFSVVPGVEFQFPSQKPDGELPPGFSVETGSRGEIFTLSVQNPSVNMDIPLDPSPGVLSVSKTCSKERAEIGDIVLYELTLSNQGYSAITDLKIQDVLPHGFLYRDGSTTIDGKKAEDPVASSGRTMEWTIPVLAPSTIMTLSYRVAIGPDSHLGDGRNTVAAQGVTTGGMVHSNAASHQLRIVQGVFTTDGTIIGKVFLDRNGNGIQDPPGPEGKFLEPGVPGAVIFTEYGLRIRTDKDGKYSVFSVKPGTHVLRLDETSLPPSLRLVSLHNRFMGDDRSQFVDMHPHGLVKANFGVRVRPGHAWPPEAGLLNEKDVQAPEESPKIPLEEQIPGMDNALAFISPADKAVLPKDTVDVILKGHSGGSIKLFVNGREASRDRLATVVADSRTKVSAYEFLGVSLQAGESNTLEARLLDPYGNQRGAVSITVECTGKPAKIKIDADDKGFPANPSAPVEIPVSLVDNKERVVGHNGLMEVEASMGKILNPDANPDEDGLQIAYESGRAALHIQPPVETGQAVIRVRSEGLSKEQEVYFTPHLRDMMIVGSGEVVLGLGDSDGDYTALKKERSFDENGYADGRAAVFAQGRVFDKNLLTIGVDTAKDRDRRDDNIFNSQEQTLDSPDKYPIYGDESESEYLAQSREKVYAKIERDKSSLMYGDFETAFTGSRLAEYNRSFTGGYGDLNLKRFRLQGMATKSDQALIVDVLRAKGSSGYYYLSEMDLVEGSERVVIEVRDRNQVERVLSRKTLSRGSDYNMEYDLGAVLFMEPAPSYDINFNPIYIVINYESRSPHLDYYAYGGRSQAAVFSWLDVGATGVVEENDLANYNLTGGDMALHLPWRTDLRAEYAQTRAIFDELGVLGPENGEGWRFDLESRPVDKLSLSGYYQNLSEFFSNPSAIGVQRGVESLGGKAQYALDSGLSFSAQYYEDDDRLNNRVSQTGAAAVAKKFAKTQVEAGVVYENITEGANASKRPDYLRTFETDRPALDHETSVMAGAGYDYSEKLSFKARHHHSVTGSGYHLTDAGVNAALTDKTTGYIRQEYAEYSEYDDMHTTAGLESQVGENTTAYNEMRLEGGASGERNHQIVGLKHRLRFTSALTGDASMEYAQTIAGEADSSIPDGFALGGALRYIPDDLLKVTTRAEYTMEDSAWQTRRTYLGEAGLIYKMHPDYSLLARARGFWDLSEQDGDQVYSRTMAGLAFRPIQSDAFHMLAKTEYKYEDNQKSTPKYESHSVIPSIEGVYQASHKTQFIGKYAAKFQTDGDLETYTDLWSGRIIYDITDRFDASAGYRVLTAHTANGSMRQGGFAELGVRAFKNLWISGGYCFDDFDTDLTGDSFQGQGPYIRIRFKFDENLFAKK